MKSLLSFGMVVLLVCSSFSAYGGAGPNPTATIGPVDVLSDTMGVNFDRYFQQVLHDIRLNWHNNIPESAKAPIMKKGKLTIRFAILKNGKIARMKLVARSGDFAFDHGAWAGITNSNPFPPLPSAFPGEYLELRMTFCYNAD
jgi:TonB family protein